jgi:hypothetical protein
LLAAFGVLAGLLCDVKATAVAGRWRWAFFAGVAAAQAFGILSKESAVVLPGVMLLYDMIWSERTTWRARIPAYAAVALPVGALFYIRSQLHLHMIVSLADNPLVKAGFWTARLTEPGLFEAHVNLANALVQTPGGIAEALAEYEVALRLRADPVVREMAGRLRAKQ